MINKYVIVILHDWNYARLLQRNEAKPYKFLSRCRIYIYKVADNEEKPFINDILRTSAVRCEFDVYR